MIAKSLHRSVDLVNSVEKSLVTNKLIRGTDKVLLSISGGQDSICLLVVLNQLHAQMELDLGLLWCHHLWQIDSFSLMRQMAKISYLFQLNSCFAVTPNPVPSELLARNWRHNCSYRICFFYNYYKITLAHSANDKVETILLNLMRGTGVTGLSPLGWKKKIAEDFANEEEHVSQFFTFPTSLFCWSPFFVFQENRKKGDEIFINKRRIKYGIEKKKNVHFTPLGTPKGYRKSHVKKVKIRKCSSLVEMVDQLDPNFLAVPVLCIKKKFPGIIEKVKLKKKKNKLYTTYLPSVSVARHKKLLKKTKSNNTQRFDFISYTFLKICSTSLEQIQNNSHCNLFYPSRWFLETKSYSNRFLINFLQIKLVKSTMKSRHLFVCKIKNNWCVWLQFPQFGKSREKKACVQYSDFSSPRGVRDLTENFCILFNLIPNFLVASVKFSCISYADAQTENSGFKVNIHNTGNVFFSISTEYLSKNQVYTDKKDLQQVILTRKQLVSTLALFLMPERFRAFLSMPFSTSFPLLPLPSLFPNPLRPPSGVWGPRGQTLTPLGSMQGTFKCWTLIEAKGQLLTPLGSMQEIKNKGGQAMISEHWALSILTANKFISLQNQKIFACQAAPGILPKWTKTQETDLWNPSFQNTSELNSLQLKKNYSTIRPLLSVNRFEISKLCLFWQLPVYPDKSNQKVNFLRNRVRNQLLPTIKLFFNSRIETVLLQFAEIFFAEDSYINEITNELFQKLLMAKTAPQFFGDETLVYFKRSRLTFQPLTPANKSFDFETGVDLAVHRATDSLVYQQSWVFTHNFPMSYWKKSIRSATMKLVNRVGLLVSPCPDFHFVDHNKGIVKSCLAKKLAKGASEDIEYDFFTFSLCFLQFPFFESPVKPKYFWKNVSTSSHTEKPLHSRNPRPVVFKPTTFSNPAKLPLWASVLFLPPSAAASQLRKFKKVNAKSSLVNFVDHRKPLGVQKGEGKDPLSHSKTLFSIFGQQVEKTSWVKKHTISFYNASIGQKNLGIELSTLMQGNKNYQLQRFKNSPPLFSKGVTTINGVVASDPSGVNTKKGRRTSESHNILKSKTFKNTFISHLYTNYYFIGYADHDKLTSTLSWTSLKLLKPLRFSVTLEFKMVYKNVDILQSIKTLPRYSVPVGVTFWMWNRKLCVVKKSNLSSERKKRGALFCTFNKTLSCNINPLSTIPYHSSRVWDKNRKKTSVILVPPKGVPKGVSKGVSKLLNSKLLHTKKIGNILTPTFFLKFDKFDKKKKEIYWPLIISFLPIALQRRFVKLFLVNENKKQVRYSQIEHFITITKKFFL